MPLEINLNGIADDLLTEKDWTYGNRSSSASKKRRAYLYAKGISLWVRAAVGATRDQRSGEINLRKVADFLNQYQPEGVPITSFEGSKFVSMTISRLLYETEPRNTAWVEFEFEREVARLGDRLTPEGRKRLEAQRDEMIREGVELGRMMRMDDQPVRKPEHPFNLGLA